ncbi:hypothetical protein BESB_058420 [Besnoitia besnoiti]|uniref:Phosphatidylethanolamine-binding protein n=1 Tax=Besnoitia besnoiti TaxID=94643 RepID=A0A2A9MAE0_BESBE|nr:hypothetical protein BESB_058420 [Besnoitia besnoiti]PFH34955.1 hypothetical protein BESB_058420 [Besnoitia besnoiti]
MGFSTVRRRTGVFVLALCILTQSVTCQTDSDFRIESPEFGVSSCSDTSSMALLPDKHFGTNCGDKNELPQLTWNDAPFNAGSFALIIADTSSSRKPVAHLIAWDIPASVTSLGSQTNFSTIGAVTGTNGNGDTGYTGPCPEKHACVKISVFALRPSSLELPSSRTYEELQKKLLELSEKGNLLDIASLYTIAVPHQPDRVRTEA